jgi:hypothetical protein
MYVFRRPWIRSRRRRTLPVPRPQTVVGSFVGAGIHTGVGPLVQERAGWGVVTQSVGAFPAPYLFGPSISAAAGTFFIGNTNLTAPLSGAGSLFNVGDPNGSWSNTGALVGVGSLFAAGTVTATP